MSNLASLEPLHASAMFASAFESCKTMTSLSICVKTDTETKIYIDHAAHASENVIDYVDQFTVQPASGLFKMVNLKSKFYRVRIQNTSGTDQTYLRCFLKPSTTPVEDMNIHISADSDDSVIMYGKTENDELKVLRVTDDGEMSVSLEVPQFSDLTSAIQNLNNDLNSNNGSSNDVLLTHAHDTSANLFMVNQTITDTNNTLLGYINNVIAGNNNIYDQIASKTTQINNNNNSNTNTLNASLYDIKTNQTVLYNKFVDESNKLNDVTLARTNEKLDSLISEIGRAHV